MLQSLFVTGTDTDVGKTCVCAGLAVSLRLMGIDIGVMKPFASGVVDPTQRLDYKSDDVRILAGAAQVSDPESMINPQFFPMSASPYTAWKTLKTEPSVPAVLSQFEKLSALHEMLIVEGIGGIMTPILEDYFVADLIRDIKTPVVLVTKTRIGTINHTVMTVKMCERYKIPVRGIIINGFDDGYPVPELKRDLQSLTEVKVLGSIPMIKDMGDESLYSIFKKNIDIKSLLN